MKTIAQAYNYIIEQLESKTGNIPVMARHLLQDLFQVTDHYADRFLTSEDWDRLRESIKKLNEGMPLQYVTGLSHFYGLQFLVTSSVLIPRPETEELVDALITELKSKPDEAYRVLDIGTGSGCIALTLKHVFPLVKVVAMDKSPDALKIAEINAGRLNLEIELIADDITSPVTPVLLDSRWNYIISNPPYIQKEEVDRMDDHVLRFEPAMALFPESRHPLDMYHCILNYGSEHLYPGGKIYLELNEFLANEIKEMAMEMNFKKVQLLQDMQGKDRIVIAEKNL